MWWGVSPTVRAEGTMRQQNPFCGVVGSEWAKSRAKYSKYSRYWCGARGYAAEPPLFSPGRAEVLCSGFGNNSLDSIKPFIRGKT